MKSQIYFRQDQYNKDEFLICSQHFPTHTNRTSLKQNNSPVICRYSALPFNRELEQDLKNMGCHPINSSNQHSYIAEMGWIYDLEGLTFPTWFNLSDIPGDFPLVIKGKTNSRKFEWNTKMYAKNKHQAINIMHELWHDPLIGPQGIVFRKYVPLKTYEIGINDMPMTHEWRFFFYKTKLIDYGFYWTTINNLDEINTAKIEPEGMDLAIKSAQIISEYTNFFVIDIAQDLNNKWWVVEVNDAQMSGLSLIPTERFYLNLKEVLNN